MKIIEKIKSRILPDLDLIKNYYKTDNLKTIAEKYQISERTLKKILKQTDFKFKSSSESKRKYTIDENFFENIDSEKKAYFLGLMYADGTNSEKRNSIEITLLSEDQSILEKFKDSISFSGPIKDKISSWNYKGERKTKIYKRLSITNEKISKDLSNQGCFSKKSLTLSFPNQKQVPNFLIRHFIRGYFDGDGWLVFCGGEKNAPNVRAGIISTLNFCEALSNLLKKEIGISGELFHRIEHDKNTYMLRFNGNKNCLKFLSWIYQDSTISLERKHEKLKKICLEIFKFHFENKKGVSVDTRNKKPYYSVQKSISENKNQKRINLGSFNSYEDALRSSMEWDIKNKDFLILAKNILNFSDENLIKDFQH